MKPGPVYWRPRRRCRIPSGCRWHRWVTPCDSCNEAQAPSTQSSSIASMERCGVARAITARTTAWLGSSRSPRIPDLQPPDPDIAIPHGISVVLQPQRFLRRVRNVKCRAVVVGDPVDLDVVLYQNTVVQHGHARTVNDLSLFVELRRVKDDVVGLPLARPSRRIHQWRVLLVNRSRLAVVIRSV